MQAIFPRKERDMDCSKKACIMSPVSAAMTFSSSPKNSVPIVTLDHIGMSGRGQTSIHLFINAMKMRKSTMMRNNVR